MAAAEKTKAPRTEVKELLPKRTNVSIRPYFEGASNMGLEKYGMVLHDNIVHIEALTCLTKNGISKYVTGLDEFSEDVISIKNPEQKAARVAEIRKTVAMLEERLGTNPIPPKSIESKNPEDFWDKVKMLHPTNHDFWSNVEIRVGNNPTFLNANKPEDLILLHAIEAGGFSIIAKSLKDAQTRATPPKFYLDKLEDTSVIRTEIRKLRNKAKVELQKLFDTNTDKLFLVAKLVDANSFQYVKNTPHNILYENMDMFVDGEGVEPNKRKAIDAFNRAVGMSIEELKIRTTVKDATYYRFIAVRPDGGIYHAKTGALMGKNPEDVVAYLSNPMHEDTLGDLVEAVENEWKQ